MFELYVTSFCEDDLHSLRDLSERNAQMFEASLREKDVALDKVREIAATLFSLLT